MGKRVLKTKLCDILGIEYPILSAGMGPNLIGERPGAPVELVVAVSEAGGLGVLGAAGLEIDEMRDAIREIKKRTDKPFGVDLLFPREITADAGGGPGENLQHMPLKDLLKTLPKAHYDWMMKIKEDMGLPDVEVMVALNVTTMRPHAAVKVCLEEKVPLFCSGLGNPGFMVKDAHAVGMKVLGIAGNTKNIRRIAASGADLVVAQGSEGGGHTGRIGSLAFWPQAIDAAAPVTVGRGVAAALAMGCVGVWVGTRFLASTEGGALDAQKKAILRATDEDTRRSYLYTGKTSRVIYNKFHDLWDQSGLDPLPFPIQMMLTSALVEMFIQANREEYIAPFSGQIAGLIQEIKPAAEILNDLVEEAVDILSRRLPENVTVK